MPNPSADSSASTCSTAEILAALGPVRQLGYVVEDLDASVAAWQEKLGVGPWTIMRGITLLCEFEGQPSEPRIDIALAYRGDVQIELIQQHNAAPSPYLRHIESDCYGLHHTAFLTETIDAHTQALCASGLKLACDIRMPMGGRYVYFHSPMENEHSYIELLEATPMMKQLFATGIHAAQHADGKLRPLTIRLAWPLKIALRLTRMFSAKPRPSTRTHQ